MDLQAVGASATIALLCAVLFACAAKGWHFVTRVIAGHPSFADSIMCESAQRFRDHLQELSRRQSVYFGAGTMFVIVYAAASMFQVPELFAGFPRWQLYAVFATLLAALALAGFRLVQILIDWRRVRYLHDANLAVGHQLQRLAGERGRVYHDVPTTAGVVDHVLAGPGGLYAVTVLARRHFRPGTVSLDEHNLTWSNAKEPVSLVEVTAGAQRLGRDLREVAAHPIRVRSVIAVPGWEVSEQLGHHHLLVNERTLPMLRGWRSREDFLLDEDVDAVHAALSARCARGQRRALKKD